jgi:hypothetical protein
VSEQTHLVYLGVNSPRIPAAPERRVNLGVIGASVHLFFAENHLANRCPSPSGNPMSYTFYGLSGTKAGFFGVYKVLEEREHACASARLQESFAWPEK